MDSMQYAEKIVREFLLFRGFTQSLRSFDADLAVDRAQGFQVDRIVDLFFTKYVPQFEAEGMVSLYKFLKERFFSRLDARYQPTVVKLETSLKRYYIAHAVQKGRMDYVVSFFEKYSEELLDAGDEWHAWFAIPYLKNPAADPRFQVYFTKEWRDTLVVSLRNFLCEVFSNIRLPTILNFNEERVRRQAMEAELADMRAECTRMQGQLAARNHELAKLRILLGRAEQSEDTTGGTPAATSNGPSDEPGGSRAEEAEPSADPNQLHLLPVSYPYGAEPRSSNGEPLRAPVLLGAEVGLRRTGLGAPEKGAGEIGGGAGGSSREALGGGRPGEHGPQAGRRLGRGWAESSLNLADVGAALEGRTPDAETLPEVCPQSQELFSGHTSPIARCRFSPTGVNVASASTDGTVRVWTPGASVPRNATRNATIYCGAEVMSLEWESKTDRLLLVGTAERGIKVWNVDAKRVVCDLATDSTSPRVLDLRCSPVDAVFVCSSASARGKPQGVGGMGLGALTAWNMRTWKPLSMLPLGEEPPVVTSLCFNHNGKILATAATDGVIRLFDMVSWLPITGWPAQEGGAAACVRFSQDESSLLTLGSDGRVLEWSLHNQGQIVRTRDASRFCATAARTAEVPRHEMALESSGGSLLLTCDVPAAPIFSMKGQDVQLALKHGGRVTSVDWHPFQASFLTGSADHSVRVTRLP